MKGDEEKARAAGCDHYVTKPTARCSSCAPSGASSASKDRELSAPLAMREQSRRATRRSAARRMSSLDPGQEAQFIIDFCPCPPDMFQNAVPMGLRPATRPAPRSPIRKKLEQAVPSGTYVPRQLSVGLCELAIAIEAHHGITSSSIL